jgi:eukaryotic-like serine/threonine-protein kinase
MERGQILDGRYRLLERVGAGGMGEVWRAADLELGRDVAIKCLHQWGDWRDLEASRQQLRHEAKAMAQLDNPHIVKVHDIFDHDGAPCLTMEYVRGRNLRDVLDAPDTPNMPDSPDVPDPSGGSLPPQRVAEIGAQIADALRAVHEKDIVHGDVKPGNVLIDEHGTAKLTDFGIARQLNANSTMTVAGALRGTPGYVAPEVANGAKITPESDMFGLGATLFAAVERVSPYGEGDGWELVRRAQAYGVDGEPLRPFHGPQSLAVVVLRLLARNPGRRPSAPLACRAFEALGDVSAPVPLPREPLPTRMADVLYPWRRTAVRHRRAVTATATAALVFAAVLAGLSLDRHSRHGSSGAESIVATPAASAVPPAIGDPHTVDPCALTDANALGRYGQTQTNANYGNFDRCDVLVQTAAGAQIDVEAQFQAPGALAGAPSPSPDTTGSPSTVNVARPPGQSGECDRYLYLSGGYGVVVSAGTDGSQLGPSNASLCAMADTATTSAVTALDHGPLRRRDAAGASLVHADACRLLDASALAAVPGVKVANYQAGFGDFSCQWASASSGTSVSLRFDQNDPLDSTDGTPMRLGGRAAYVQAGGDSDDTSNCLAQVEYRNFSGVGGPTEELLYLVVDGSKGYGDQANNALCGQATRLAAAASAALTEG